MPWSSLKLMTDLWKKYYSPGFLTVPLKQEKLWKSQHQLEGKNNFHTEHLLVGASFISTQYRHRTCNFIKKESLAQVFSCEFCEISKNCFFKEHLRWLLLQATIWQYYYLHIYNITHDNIIIYVNNLELIEHPCLN